MVLTIRSMVKEIRCILWESPVHAGRMLEALLYKQSGLLLLGTVSGRRELEEMLATESVDMVFVAMPDMDEALRRYVSGLSRNVLVVLHSPQLELAAEFCYRGGITFLPDPLPYDAFSETVEHWRSLLAFRKWQQQAQHAETKKRAGDYFFVKSDYKIMKVVIDEILFIESLGEYIRIYTEGDKIVTLQSLSRMEKLLPGSHFFRIHRSYIINLDKVKFIQNYVVAIGKHQLPVSKSQRKAFLEFIQGKGVL